MATSFACVIYRTERVSERALSRGFAVALAGFDVHAPVILTAELRSIPGWSVAFYKSGLKVPAFEELDHACEVFEEELPPGLAVRDAVGTAEDAVYAVVYSDEVVHDDAWRFGERSLRRHFVREADDGVEAGEETLDESTVTPIDLDPDADDATVDARLKSHRGTTFVSNELRAAVLPALVGALFEADRRVPVRLVEPDAASIAEETRRLNRVLRRVDGRGAAPWPASCAGVAPPDAARTFVATYDFEDPSDPTDLYRELSIGRIEGTLHFMRASDVTRVETDAVWGAAAKAGLFPLATLASTALGGGGRPARLVGLAADGERLVLVDRDKGLLEAGPTFGELLFYLSLGFKTRDDIEEDVIGALMLRARVRTTRDESDGARR
ncbi:MAG: hypothetical protein HOW73_03910 [Polyangiaceae bacterium]|nr:hypothetical protein [Polyangiaceae bacterium]